MSAIGRALSGCQIFDGEALPAGWTCVPLGDRINLAYGVGLPEALREPGDIAVYGSNGVVGSHQKPLVDGPGILIGRKGTVGAVHFATGPFWPIDTVYYVLTLTGDCLRFLYHLLNYLPLKFLNAATGVPGLSRRDVYALRGAFPPLSEQATIAHILDAVDTTLERTREAAARARDVRYALLRACFEFVESKEPKKETKIGRIPRTWDAIVGRQAFTVVTGGCTSVDTLKVSVVPDSWFMKVDDLNDPANRRSIVRTKIGFRADENELFNVLPVGTVVIAKRGVAIMKNRVRTTAVPVSLDPNLMALRVLSGMHPEFLRLQLEWRNLSRYIENSGVPQLNNKDLYPRYFLRAPSQRQSEVIEIIGAAERLEDTLIAKCAALEQVKEAIMCDLMTGKVRVRSALTEAMS